MEKTFANGNVKECCKAQDNLKLLEDESRNGLTVKKCRVCGCRHRHLQLEPGMIGLRMQPGH